MRYLFKAGFIWLGMLLSLSAWGQDVPLGALPMQYNGSFAGETGAPRVSLSSMYGWLEYQGSDSKTSYFSSTLSYDQYIPQIGIGVGLTAGVSRITASPEFNYTKNEAFGRSVALDIAPKLSIKGKYTLSPSIAVNYEHVEEKSAFMPHSLLPAQTDWHTQILGGRLGLLWNTSKYYIGVAYTYRDVQFKYKWGNSRSVEVISTLQLGYTFQKSSASNFSITPQLLFLIKTPHRNIAGTVLDEVLGAYHLNFRYKKFIWGVNNAGLHLGLQNERIRLMLTGDPAYFNYESRADDNKKQYSGNFSLRYIFTSKK